MHFLAVSSKVNAEIVDGSVKSHFSTKIVKATMVEIKVTRLDEIIILIVGNRDMSGRTASN
jgi:hypothetical protein